jgi:L-fuconolactonase
VTGIVVDAHQHVWDLERAEYSWLDGSSAPIDRTITIDEVKPALRRAGIDGTVLVQSADNAEDTALMFDVAAGNPEVLGVVGYVPLGRPADAARVLGELRANPLFVGVRNLIHDMPDPDWLLRPEVDESLGLLEQAGVPFDLVAVLPRHLELVPIISERHPALRIVIDHLAKPPVGLDSLEPWSSLMARAAENPHVFAKASGLYSAAGDPGSWTPASVRPAFDRALSLFGANRLMYGGDWPISILAGGYERVWAGLTELFAGLASPERAAILGDTAVSFYGLDGERVTNIRASLGE